MRNEQIRQTQPLLQIHQQVDDLRLNRNIERRHRFVTDQQLGLHRQRASNADTLPLPPEHSCG